MELKNCPFCGETPVITKGPSVVVIECKKCGFDFAWSKYSDYVGEWNTRPIEDALQNRIQELIKECNSNYEPLRQQLNEQAIQTRNLRADLKVRQSIIDDRDAEITRLTRVEYAYNIVINQLRAAIRGILANPQGCPMCDAGVVRNPEKPHWPDCPYAVASGLVGEDEAK